MPKEVDWFSVTTLLLLPVAGSAALVFAFLKIRASRDKRQPKTKVLAKTATSNR